MDEERRRLEALAFGRDTAEVDRGQALETLRDLDTEREAAAREAEALAAESEDAVVAPRRRRRLLLIVSAVVALGVAVAVSVALRPPDNSLNVFERSQVTQDLADAALLEGPESTSHTVRALDEGDNWKAFALRGTRDEVCLGLFSDGALSMVCTSPKDFAVRGLTISADYSGSSQQLLNGRFEWGPRGPLRAKITSA